jgi:hypothetical protein
MYICFEVLKQIYILFFIIYISMWKSLGYNISYQKFQLEYYYRSILNELILNSYVINDKFI